MTILSVLALATFLPLVVLTSWTLDIKPGAGPQGGEVIFLGWLMVALWLTLLTLLAAVRHTAGSAVFRYAGVPAGVLVGAALFFWLVFHLLNDASLVEVPRARGRAEIFAAAGLVGGLILANGFLLRSK